MTLPTATELLRRWDEQRPRSQQTAMGMSKLGSCHRQAGYHLQGYPADEEYKASGIQNVLGTSVHDTLAEAAAMFLPGAQAEGLEVTFGGLAGHPDLVMDGTVRDYKTTSYALQLEQRKQLGPPLRERYQVHCYGAGLILAGHPIHTVEIDYIDRGSGDEWLWNEPFSLDVVGEAMSWLEQVRTAEVAILPRDYRPESAFCTNCPFFRRCWDAEPGKDPRSVLYVDDPDAATWSARLIEARRRKKAAEAEIADAQGALDALRTVSRPGEREYITVPGMDKQIRFAVNKGKTSPNMPAIAEDYKRAGARPPMKTGDPIIAIAFVKPREDDDD